MHNPYDIIIIGAGPSGTSCAYNIKRLNPTISVLLLDKAAFPRYKPCGGGISPEVHNYLDFNLDEAISYRCSDIVMVANGEHMSTSMGEVLMARREVLDDFLLNKAKLQGVEVVTACEAIDIKKNDKFLVVATTQGEFTAKIAILAEGSRGKLARKLGIAPANRIFAAMEYEHYTKNLDGKLYINFDHNDGYAWNFPKADGLSLGIGGLKKGKGVKGDGLPKKLRKFASEFEVSELEQHHTHGHPIQLYNGRQKLVHDRILLIGEVAGCVDPLTAEGIRPAIKSGYLAAKIVAKAIECNKFRYLKQYNALFHREIGKDFQYARILSYLVYNYRKVVLPFLSSKMAIEKFMSVFNGSSTYRAHISKKRILKIISNLLLQRMRTPN
jgi:geranylgeranyl reductase family protein